MNLKFACFLFGCALAVVFTSAAHAQQIADPHFDARVEAPAFTKNFPRVLFDEAHNNVDDSHGRYKPFADLIFNDGYHLVVNRQLFTKASLDSVKILVIVNPLGAGVFQNYDRNRLNIQVLNLLILVLKLPI